MLKPIPVEPLAMKKETRRQNKKSVGMLKLDPRKVHKLDADNRFIRHVCMDFIQYMEKGATYDIFKIGRLIYNLRRSVLGLERKRFKLLRKKKRNHGR